MKTKKKSLAEALRKAHAALLEDLRKLEQASRLAAGAGAIALRARLRLTRAHLAEHFRFEEQDGYMGALRQREPRLERTIAGLADEHRRLMQSLKGLIREAGAAGAPNDGIGKKIRAWIRSVRRHEARESELVQDAFNTDIGAED
jgi:hypothetical protein